MKKYIAIFDSGVGGLTLLECARRMMPAENFLYFADSANVPYGDKDPEDIIALVDHAIKSITDKYDLKAVVLACNTATSVAAHQLREKYSFPIIGMEPAVKSAMKEGDPRKILVLATELTLKESKYSSLIDKLDLDDKVDELALGGLVDLAEEFELDGSKVESYLKKSLSGRHADDYHSVVLGCTHFLYYKEAIQSYFGPSVEIVDGHLGTVKHLMQRVNGRQFGEKGDLKCMLSGLNVGSEVLAPYLMFLSKGWQVHGSPVLT